MRYNTRKPCKNGHYADRMTSNGMCVGCKKAYRKANPENHRDSVKRYKKKNPDKLRAQKRKSYKKNPDRHLAATIKWRANNPEKYMATKKEWVKRNRNKVKAYRKKHYEKHKEKTAPLLAAYKKSHPEIARRRRKERMASDPTYSLIIKLRKRVAKVLKGKSKSTSTLELLGCSAEEYRQHLESQFTPGMTWGNHAFDGWHIDHIRPLSSFDLTDPAQQREAFHYTNCQPLWAKDNLEKGATWEA